MIERDLAARPAPLLRGGHRRHHHHHQHRSGAGDRRYLRAPQTLAARGRRLCRFGRHRPEFRWVFAGCDRADSLVVNPHKWLLTPMDCSVFYTRRPEMLRQAFSLVPDILRHHRRPRAVNLMDYGVPLGRRFRALKLWFVMRSYGREGLAAVIRAAHPPGAANSPARWRTIRVSNSPPRLHFSTICFRYRGTDAKTAPSWSASTPPATSSSRAPFEGRYTLRLTIGKCAPPANTSSAPGS